MKLYGTIHNPLSKEDIAARKHLKRLAVVGRSCGYCGGYLYMEADKTCKTGFRLVCLNCGREG